MLAGCSEGSGGAGETRARVLVLCDLGSIAWGP